MSELVDILRKDELKIYCLESPYEVDWSYAHKGNDYAPLLIRKISR